MRVQTLKLAFSLATFCGVLFWINHNKNYKALHNQHIAVDKKAESCNICKENATITRLLGKYSSEWKKQEEKFNNFRSMLNSKCQGISKAVVTQNNTLLGTEIVGDGQKRHRVKVTETLFSTFAEEQPFGKAEWESCAVVGNGGILLNSSCGEEIDSANFVIRCNLPPLGEEYSRDVGNKTSLVTANPSILHDKFNSLNERRRPFVENLRPYGDSLLLLPAFSYIQNTGVCLRVLYTLEDFGLSCPRPVFLNPEYLIRLSGFWHDQGLRTVRLSSGVIMASLALELCNNVHLYGFWPFELHPNTHETLFHHYYDNVKYKAGVHDMPTEFEHLLKLHAEGVIHLHVGECPSHGL